MPEYVQIADTTGMLISGKTSVGMLSIEMIPKMARSTAITMKV
jgi:hypothetical protein